MEKGYKTVFWTFQNKIEGGLLTIDGILLLNKVVYMKKVCVCLYFIFIVY